MKKVSIQEAFDKFKPESCVFVISVDKKGKPNGMIAGWKTRCSWEPPLFAVSLSKEGNTHRLIRQSREFVVAVPNKGLEKEVRFFGSRNGAKIDKFLATGIETEKAKFIKSPLVRRATINFECKLQKEVNCGDHVMFIGRIVAVYVNKNKKILFNLGINKGKMAFKEV
jgi:flavin reductase (DIM6/NTAB) family NADH-FMN oxidoreductase RutF